MHHRFHSFSLDPESIIYNNGTLYSNNIYVCVVEIMHMRMHNIYIQNRMQIISMKYVTRSFVLPIKLRTIRGVHWTPACNAGHSKWANIRHIKALKDGQKSLQFIKLSRQIRLAVQGTHTHTHTRTNAPHTLCNTPKHNPKIIIIISIP